jgi:hypothetical protein
MRKSGTVLRMGSGVVKRISVDKYGEVPKIRSRKRETLVISLKVWREEMIDLFVRES